MKANILRPDYTSNESVYQLVLPMDIGELISADDLVRLLGSVLERMDYGKLYAAYSRLGRIEASPEHLFKIMIYGYMNGIYASRKLEQALPARRKLYVPVGPRSRWDCKHTRSAWRLT